MSTNYKSDDAAGIRRNVESHHERRGRLRAIEAVIESGSLTTSGGRVALPAPALDRGGQATLTAANARMTARVVGILDRVGNAIVADIADAAERVSQLRSIAARAKKPSQSSERPTRPPAPIVDVEVVEVQPDKPTE